MKVVNCIHCGTSNVIDEHGYPAARCIKCGNYVEASTTLLSLLPTWAIWLFCIIGLGLMFAFPFLIDIFAG